MGAAYGQAALGFTFAGGVIVFTLVGWVVDRWLDLVPIMTVIGALTGSVLSFLSVYFRIRQAEDERRRKRASERD